jgi:hypothetical protein
MGGRWAVAVLLLAVASFASACASAGAPSPPSDEASQELLPGEESVILVVSMERSSSRLSESTHVIRMQVDGKPLDPCWLDHRKEATHRFYFLALEPGEHVLKALTDAGGTVLAWTFRVTGRHWAHLFCRSDADPERRLTFDLGDRDIVFF